MLILRTFPSPLPSRTPTNASYTSYTIRIQAWRPRAVRRRAGDSVRTGLTRHSCGMRKPGPPVNTLQLPLRTRT